MMRENCNVVNCTIEGGEAVIIEDGEYYDDIKRIPERRFFICVDHFSDSQKIGNKIYWTLR